MNKLKYSFLIILCILTFNCYSQELVEGFFIEDAPFSEQFNQPMSIEQDPTNPNRIFVAERSGLIWLCNWDGVQWVKSATPMIDIQDQVGPLSGERGLQDMVIHGIFLIASYTVEESTLFDEPLETVSATIGRVSKWEFFADGTTVYPEDILIGETIDTGIPITSTNHCSMSLAMVGGWLQVGTGDGGSDIYRVQAIERGILRPELNIQSIWRSQVVNSLQGKILRINPITGNAVSSNPFYDFDNPTSAESKVWSMGLRNPFRITSDVDNNTIIADVGSNEKEEINVADKGGLNFGWGMFEGMEQRVSGMSQTNPDEGELFGNLLSQSTSFADSNDDTQRRYNHTLPEITTDRLGQDLTELPRYTNGVVDPEIDVDNPIGGNSITGGIMIEGDAMSEQFNGAYIWSDYSADYVNVGIRSFDDSGRYFNETINIAPNGTGNFVVDLFQAPDGSVYLVSLFQDIERIYYDDSTLSNPNITSDSDYIKSFNSSLVINLNGKHKDFSLYNVEGKIVLKDRVEGYYKQQLNVAKGIYFVVIDNISKKIVVN